MFIRIQLPALRDRKEDIEQLAGHFLKLAADELAVEPKILSKQSIERLKESDWPGNVRQLENICRFLTVMASGKEILPADLPQELYEHTAIDDSQARDWKAVLSQWTDEQLIKGKEAILENALPEFEKIMLQRALLHTGGHKQEAAKKVRLGKKYTNS